MIEHFSVKKGVAGYDISNTAFIFEALMLRELKGKTLKNAINSPGEKILQQLEKTDIKKFNELKQAYDKIINTGPTSVIKK